MSAKTLMTMLDENDRLLPGLPDDLGILCLAKMPISSRLKVSSLCQSWKGLFQKDVFWRIRREHSTPEHLIVLWANDNSKNGVWHALSFLTREWFKLPGMPNDSRGKGMSVSALADGKLFVIGGIDRDLNADGLWVSSSKVSYFDFKSYRWEATAPLNIPRHSLFDCCVPAVLDDKVHVFGGLNWNTNTSLDNSMTTTVEAYDPISRTWTLLPSVIPFDLSSGLAMEGNFYAVTSEDLTGAIYDSHRGEWTAFPENLNIRWYGDPIEFQGQICEKIDPDNDGPALGIMAYNLSEDTWEVIYGQVSQDGHCPRRRFGGWRWDWDNRRHRVPRSKLVKAGGRLYTIHVVYYNCETFEIRDLTNTCVASRTIMGIFEHMTQDERDMALEEASLARARVDAGQTECADYQRLGCRSGSIWDDSIENTQCTLNNRMVVGSLMNLADNPTRVSVGQAYRISLHHSTNSDMLA